MKTNWDLTHLYKDINEYKNDYDSLLNNAEELKNRIDNFLDSEESFLNFLRLKFESELLVEKLYCYAKRHIDIDSTLNNYKEMMQEVLNIHNSIQGINNKFENILIDNEKYVNELLEDNRLKHYKRYIHLILRKKQHILDDIDSYPSYTNELNRIKDAYQTLFSANIKFEDVIIDGERKILNRNSYNDLILDKKQENRKLVFDTYTNAYIKANNDISKLYIDKLKNDIDISNKQKYHNLLNQRLFELELPNEILDSLIKTVNDNLGVMHEYTKLKKQISGLEEYHVYDSSASISAIPKIEYDLEETIKIIKNSLNILGDDYISVIDRMFNEGWVDVYPAPNKRTMSFTCISYVGVPYILINYNGSINSARTLAHEIGHTMHVYYSKNHNAFEYFEFSYFLTEIASKVNEILVNEYMFKNCKTKEEEKYILNNIISSIGNSIFGQVMLTEFEHTIINKLSNNEEVNAQILNDVYYLLSKKYNGDNFAYDENLKYGWSKIPHFIMQDTYYVYQYAIGSSIAANIAYRILNGEENLVSKYKEFLSLGSSVSIKEALEHVDINLENGTYVDDAIDVLKNKIKVMEKLYK